MLKRFLIIVTVVCFFLPAIVCAEYAPQFNKSSTDKTDLSKNAPTHGKIYKSKIVMETESSESVKDNAAMKNAETGKALKGNTVMEREVLNSQKQTVNIPQGTVNE